MIVLIDKSLFSPAERRQYEALVAKAVVADDETTAVPYASQPAANTPTDAPYSAPPTGMPSLANPANPVPLVGTPSPSASPSPAMPAAPETTPVTPPPPAVTAAIARLEQLEQSITWRECVAVARNYALLGETEESLAQTLFALKQTDEANYNAYRAALDKSMALVRKSGLFREIGKCSRASASGGYTGIGGVSGGSVMDRIQAEAEEIQRNHPELNRLSAIARAWENHPELVQEYNDTYQVR